MLNEKMLEELVSAAMSGAAEAPAPRPAAANPRAKRYARACGSRTYLDMNEFDVLFQPLRIGTMEIANRFVMPAMGTNFADENGYVTQRLIDYYVARARGGFGLQILEVSAVSPLGKAIVNQIGVWDDCFIPGLRKLTEAIHANGGKIAMQLHHCGRQTMPGNIGGGTPVAPSAIKCPVCQTLPHELTTEEVYEVIDAFGMAARRAKEAGFDAIEFNGAHGYLITQFMSSYSNKRVDEFGGNFRNRMRFPVEILRRVREEVGSGFPLIFRYSGSDYVYGGRDHSEAKMVARVLEENTVNAISVSGGTYQSLKYMSAPSSFHPGYLADMAAEVKSAVKIPVIVSGRINSADLAKEIITSGKADCVALGRVSIAEPEFPNKVRTNRLDEICQCIACLEGCLGFLFNGGSISCAVNPFVGKEGEWKLHPALRAKKVVVVGAGPAGLEAAWIMAERGHDVVVYEKEAVVGGQFRLAAIPPAKQDIATTIACSHVKCLKYGVEFKMGTECTEAMILAERPDAVILATGAKSLMLPIPGMDNPKFVDAMELLEGERDFGNRVLVIGGGLVGAETADFIGEQGAQVDMIEFKDEIAGEMQFMARAALLERLEGHRTRMVVGGKVTQFHDDGVTYEDTKDLNRVKEMRGYDTVVLAMGRKSYNPLEEVLQGKVGEVHVVGDAVRAASALKAIYQAAEIAVRI